MPIDHTPTTDRRSRPPSRACPFDWCTVDHCDDWVNDQHGDAARFHAIDLTPDARTGFNGEAPYLVVDEIRTTSGARFSTAQVQVDGRDRVELDAFAASLTAALSQLPAWRAAALAVTDLQSLLVAPAEQDL